MADYNMTHTGQELDAAIDRVSGLIDRTSSDLTISGDTVIVPQGIYRLQASKAVADSTTATASMIRSGYTAVTTEGLITGTAELVYYSGNEELVMPDWAVDISGGSGSITVEPISITQNGTYTAPSGIAYSPITVNVSEPVTQYRIVDTMEVGESYILASGNRGTVYMLTGESGGSRTLLGISTTVTDSIISIRDDVASRVLFDCVRYIDGNDATITVSKDGLYLFCNNASGLTMKRTSSLDRFWHYRNNKFWQFKSTTSDGYSDTSSEYKYYITWSNGNATDSHVNTTSIEDSDIPLLYIYKEYVPSGGETE